MEYPVRLHTTPDDIERDTEAEICQRFVQLSCEKMMQSRGTCKLRRNLLILHMLRKARQDMHRVPYECASLIQRSPTPSVNNKPPLPSGLPNQSALWRWRDRRGVLDDRMNDLPEHSAPLQLVHHHQHHRLHQQQPHKQQQQQQQQQHQHQHHQKQQEQPFAPQGQPKLHHGRRHFCKDGEVEEESVRFLREPAMRVVFDADADAESLDADFHVAHGCAASAMPFPELSDNLTVQLRAASPIASSDGFVPLSEPVSDGDEEDECPPSLFCCAEDAVVPVRADRMLDMEEEEVDEDEEAYFSDEEGEESELDGDLDDALVTRRQRKRKPHRSGSRYVCVAQKRPKDADADSGVDVDVAETPSAISKANDDRLVPHVVE